MFFCLSLALRFCSVLIYPLMRIGTLVSVAVFAVFLFLIRTVDAIRK